MNDLDPASKTKIWDILQVFSPVQSLCQCHRNFTVGVHLDEILSMSDNEVNIKGATISVSHFGSSFFGTPIHDTLCECEPIRTCHIKMPKWIWDMSAGNNIDVLLVGALWDANCISVMHEQAAVIPLQKKSWYTPSAIGDNNPIVTFEMFSGGFGGWSHAIRAVDKFGVPIQCAFALDHHQGCSWTFAKSHDFDGVVTNPQQFQNCLLEWNEQYLGHPKIVLNCAMENMWWLSIVGRFATGIWTLSPPCPPWSSADRALGLQRVDGRCMLWTLMCVGLHRPPVILLENVASLKTHQHWRVVLEFFNVIQYQIKWAHSLDLSEIIPHKRDRLILIAVDSLQSKDTSFQCQTWPAIQKPSLRTYGAIMELDNHWMKQAQLTMEEMKMYFDPCNLPRDIRQPSQIKKSKKDVVKYRLRTLDDQASCIMTSYGQPLSLYEPLVQRGGIFGCLILDGDQPRKLVLPEIVMLFGLLDKCWLPHMITPSMHYMGNAIAIPHALIAVLNGIMYIDGDILNLTVQECFAAIMGEHVTKSNIQIVIEQDGFWVSKGQMPDTRLDLTQPMSRFAMMVTQTPLGSFRIRCQFGLSILTCMKSILGASMPNQVDIHYGEDKSYHMPVSEMLKFEHPNIQIHANVMSRLLLDEKSFCTMHHDVVRVLTPDTPVCLERHPNMEIQDLLLALRVSHQNDIEWIFYGLSKQPWSLRDTCPDIVFAFGQRQVSSVLHVGDCLGLVLPTENALAWHGTVTQIDELTRVIRASLAWEFLTCVGWHFTRSAHENDALMATLFMTPKPGCLHAPFETARMLLITRIFIATLPETPGHGHVFRLCIKLWDTWIWDGWLDSDFIGEGIITAWDRASIVVGFHITMRLVINGQQASPEFEMKSFQREGKDMVKVFLVPMLHGGGSDSQAVSVASETSYESSPEVCDPIVLEHTDMQSAVSHLLEDFLALDTPNRELDLGIIRNFELLADSYKLVAPGSLPQLLDFMKYMSESGMEKILQYIGWHFTLQFIEYSQPVRVRLLVTPIPGRKHSTVTLAGGFIHTALTIMAMPLPSLSRYQRVRVKVKIWNIWAYDEWLDENLTCQSLIHSWEKTSRFVGAKLQMRMIARGKRINPDRAIKEYAQVDSNGEKTLKVFFVLELHGGGLPPGTTPDQITKAKNALASFLLDHGCDLQTVSTFSHKLVHSAGPLAIEQIMKQSDSNTKLQSIQAMGDAISLKCPETSQAKNQRDKNTQKKITKKTPVADVALNPTEFQVKQGFFVNEDNTEAAQRESIRGSSTGFVLLDPEAAKPWLASPQVVSSDELAIVVLGRCPVEGSKHCQRIGLPVFNANRQPMILDCCMHQLGSKHLKTSTLKTGDIDVVDTSVLAFTVFKDEIDSNTWGKMIRSPIRTIFEILHSIDMVLQLPVPPWGRSWRNSKGVSSPEQADSFQCHVRVETKKRNDLLRISGQVGLYTTPKDQHKKVDSDFGIIWLDLPLEQLKVTASTYPKGLGLVKIVKTKMAKVSRGLRVASVDFQDAFKHFKPSHDVPEVVNVTIVAKLSPTPVGASMDDLKKWLKQLGWKAKPIRPLKQDTWLLGFEEQIDDQFVKWGDATMLLTWLPDRHDMQSKVIIAGDVQKPRGKEGPAAPSDLLQDPWMTYLNRQKQDRGPMGDRLTPAPVNPRSVDGPTESRFKKNEEQIDELRQTMHKMSQQIEQQGDSHKELQVKVTQEFQAVRNEIARSVEESTKLFEQTLDHSLRRQDSQLQSAFSELKAIIQATPVPCKKAKVTKPGQETKEDNDHDMDS